MRKLLSKQDGFTLVELMVVVAIIGVLSAVAVPNFKKYQAKSKTSEAKLQLSAAYTAQQSFYSDFDTYAPCLLFMGFNPNNERLQRYYAVGFGTDGTAVAAIGTILTQNGATGCSNTFTAACTTTTATSCSLFGAGKTLGGTAALGTMAVADYGSTATTTLADENNFVIGAVGYIDKNFAAPTTASAFTIDQNKKIVQVRAGY